MSVLAMKKINICALKKDRRKLVETLQSMGVMEIDTKMYEDTPLDSFNTTEEKIRLRRNALSVDHALHIIEEYSGERKGMLSSLEGKKPVSRREYDRIVAQEPEYEAITRKIIRMVRHISESRAAIERNNVSIALLAPWLDLDMPMDFTGTKRTTFFIGTTRPVESEQDIRNILGEYVVDISAVEIQILSNSKRQTAVAVVCMKDMEASVEQGLHALEFSRISNGFTGIAAEEKARLDKENAELEKEIEEYRKQLAEMNVHREALEIIADFNRIEAARAEAEEQILQSEKAMFLSGYLPAAAADRTVEKLKNSFSIYVDVTDPQEDDEVPVVIESRGIGKAVGGIVESFGLPGRREIDPSMIMGVFYVFLFGLMLSDAAYGAIISGTCFFLLRKFPRMEESLKTSVQLFMYCGISTLIWGVLFGGYFGDVITVFSETFLGKEITVPALWFAPIDDPMKLLMYSMLFGIIHLFTGLGIKGYMCLRDRKYMNFLSDVVFWFMLLAGLIMMFLPSELFTSLAQVQVNMPDVLVTAAKWMAIAGAVGILLFAGAGNRNPGMRLALGAYDLYGITSWLSDLLSYSRLLALSLATGVIASVFNQMGSMMGGGPVGLVFFIVIFIVGHLFNMGINLLGAYVHTNRLQYVEFFGKFYEGGGRPFRPFRDDTKYVDLGEETE